MAEDLRPGMIVRRKPGVVLPHNDKSVPHGVPLDLQDIDRNMAFFEDLEAFACGALNARYANTDYFDILARNRPTGPVIKAWMTDKRAASDGEIRLDDLREDIAAFGIIAAPEVLEWWVRQLNDRTLEVDVITQYLSRLCDLFFAPPSHMRDFDDIFKDMTTPQKLALLRGEDPLKWRRTLIAIGRVLLRPQDFKPPVRLATTARSALDRLVPFLHTV